MKTKNKVFLFFLPVLKTVERHDCANIYKAVVHPHSRLCLRLCRLFVEVKPETPDKRQLLPLKHQQAAFNSVYLKAQEGMKLPVRPSAAGCG